jgi:hypothetical protein
MAIFPQDLKPLQAGYSANEEESVDSNDADAGQVQVRDNWNRTRYVAEAQFKAKTENVERIRNFWRLNRLIPFTWFDYEESIPAAPVNIGTGNGVATTWTVPSRDIRDFTLYFNGVAQSALNVQRFAYTGPLTEDQIHFTGAAPAGGVAITAIWTGRARYSVRFRSTPQKETVGYRRQAVRVQVYEDFG